MNIIFLDFDGVLNTIHKHTYEDIENKIRKLALKKFQKNIF